MSLGLGLGIKRNIVIGGAPAFSGVFDNYTNGLFGISVRQLRATYAGDDVEIRRSSDNATSDTGFNSNQLDQSAATTFVGANNGLTRTLYDQTANGNDAQQTTSSAQPRIINSGSFETINSKPALLFDDVNDHLLVWNDTTAPTEFQSLGSDLTVIMRINAADVSGTGGAFFQANTILELRQNIGSTYKVPFSIGVGSNKFRVGLANTNAAIENFQTTANISASTDYYLGVTITGTTLKLFISGALDSTHTISTATGDRSVGTTDSTLSIGVRTRDGGQPDANFYDGKQNEILIFSDAKSDADVIDIMNNSTI